MGLENETSSLKGHHQEYPGDVLHHALSKIDTQGQVILLDNETGEQFPWPPHRLISVETLPPDVYKHKILVVARLIHGAIFQIHSFPEVQETILQNLAISLTPYRYNPEFLTKAVSLVNMDENGFLYDPHLPVQDPIFNVRGLDGTK